MSKARRLQEGTSAASAMTIRELVFIRMVVETAKYLDMKAIPFADATKLDQRNHLKIQRGIIRGMAMAHTKMFGNGYEPHWTAEIKSCEKRAIRLAKEWINDGQPRGDGWWLKHRRDLWRSRSDAAVVH